MSLVDSRAGGVTCFDACHTSCFCVTDAPCRRTLEVSTISLAAHPYPINALQSYRIFSHNPQITLRSDLQNETSVVLFCKLFIDRQIHINQKGVGTRKMPAAVHGSIFVVNIVISSKSRRK